MTKRRDWVGQRVGRLVVVKPTNKRDSCGLVLWECRCDCGNTKLVSTAALRRGSTRSCGCMRIKDLTGQRFGRLTVVSRSKEQGLHGETLWNCRCDCGENAVVTGGSLASGGTQSCGCLRKEKMAKLSTNDLVGQRFGRLTVVRPTEERRHGAIIWELRCDCGGTAFAHAGSLKRGAVQSCGCLNKEKR